MRTNLQSFIYVAYEFPDNIEEFVPEAVNFDTVFTKPKPVTPLIETSFA